VLVGAKGARRLREDGDSSVTGVLLRWPRTLAEIDTLRRRGTERLCRP
jgi:hypothetical protein